MTDYGASTLEGNAIYIEYDYPSCQTMQADDWTVVALPIVNDRRGATHFHLNNELGTLRSRIHISESLPREKWTPVLKHPAFYNFLL